MDYKSLIDSEWHNCDYEIKEQDRYLPIANVGRVMKKALPPHAKLSRESKECIQESVSEFISFVTSQAADRCKIEKRKTLNGEDILWAMYTLGFENYAETLRIYLAKYREFEQMEAERKPPKKKSARRKAQEAKEEDEYGYSYSDSEEASLSPAGTGYSKSPGEYSGEGDIEGRLVEQPGFGFSQGGEPDHSGSDKRYIGEIMGEDELAGFVMPRMP